MPKYLTTPPLTDKMPPGVPYIVGNEAAERFSYYGMKAVLPIFMTEYLLDSVGQPDLMSEEQAREVMGWFGSAVYATPFLGAIIADRYWGKYLTIVLISLLYCVGHAVLAGIDLGFAGVEPRWILFLGLGFIALGAGGIKPCVTSHVGDQFGSMNKHLLPRVYSWFYFSINFGSMLSYFLTPLLLEHYGPAWAFGVPGVLMGVATFVFWMGRNKFVHVPAGGNEFFAETIGANGIRAMLNLLPLLLLVSMFWSLFEQSSSAWILQANKMNLVLIDHGNPETNVSILAGQTGLMNPVFVLILIPIFSYTLYPWLNRFFELTPLRKIGIGMFVMVVAFAFSALIEERIDAGGQPSILWQVPAYLILTASEVLVSITMLEFFYTQAPRRMKSLIMAFNMLSVSIGNAITGVVNGYIQNEDGTSKLPGADYYWFFTGTMLVTAIVYVVWSQFYRGQTYIQGEDQAG